MKQYMPKKPIKIGIKVWVLADSTNGYFCRLQVYTGHQTSVERGLGARVVKDLSQDFYGKWHHVYFDNFFTSKQLLCDLESLGTYGCGTARKTDWTFQSFVHIIFSYYIILVFTVATIIFIICF